MPSRSVILTLFPVALAVLGLLLWALLGNLLTPLLVFTLGVLLAIVLYPVKQFMVNHFRMPNGLSVALSVFLGLIALVVPTLIEQVRSISQLAQGLTTNAEDSELAERLPNQAASILADENVQSVLNGLRNAPSSVVQRVLDVAAQAVTVSGTAPVS